MVEDVKDRIRVLAVQKLGGNKVKASYLLWTSRRGKDIRRLSLALLKPQICPNVLGRMKDEAEFAASEHMWVRCQAASCKQKAE